MALAKGKFTIAASNNIVPPISPATRSTTAFIISVRSGRSACWRKASAAISTVANKPRTSMI